jgi:undecaprenyl pyrophosphate phosphatase UppP
MILLVIVASVLFYFSEFTLMMIKRSVNKTAKRRNDRYSLLLFWITIPVAIKAAFFLANFKPWNMTNHLIAMAGLLLYLGGLTLRWDEIFKFRKAFTVNVAITSDYIQQTKRLILVLY